MHLKNLTVFGFKSFADKTSLNFRPGITAIVGPNGCGKSNVADAIRWVLGEQSAKALRGGEMADVIFNGTDGRKPLGMAEVSLTIGDVEAAHLQAAGVEIAYNEVTLTRRVFRDGASEYFINKTPCRLRDIQQLFMGTGVGRTSYSIMAQGNITQILSSKPEERRFVFEEAAGITKFKSQKREALRKLEQTDQNLLRVADLVREVQRQIGSLQRQAGKARRYKQIQSELQHLDTQLARHQFDVLQAEIQARQARHDELRAEIETANGQVARGEQELHQLRERAADLDHEIGVAQQRGLELKNQADRFESRIQFNDHRVGELDSQKERALAEIAEANERRTQAEVERATLTSRLEAEESALLQLKQGLEQRRQSLAAVENDLRGKQELLHEAQTAVFSAGQRLSRARNEINSLEVRAQGNSARLEKLAAERIQLDEEAARVEQRLIEFSANVENEMLSAQTQRGTVEQRQQRLRELQQELVTTGQAQDALLREQAEKRSRLNVLEQLEETHEGFGVGALAALKQSQHAVGSLADMIRVPDRHVVAVETALGHHLQLVLTESPETAEAILNELKEAKRGRASVGALALAETPPDGINGASNPDHPANTDRDASALFGASTGAEGIPILALSVIEVEPRVEPILKRLLGRTWIVPDLRVATQAWCRGGGRYDFVTASGELLSRHGVYTGGYLNGNGSGKAPASILGRKNQIAELHRLLEELQGKITEISRARGVLQSEQTALQAGLQEAQTMLRQSEVAIATRQGESNALQHSSRLLKQKLETVAFEIESLARHDQEGKELRARLTVELADLEAGEGAAQARLSEIANAIEGFRGGRDAAQAALTESKVAAASAEQGVLSLRNQLQPVERRIGELAQLAAQREGELAGFDERRRQALAEIQDSRQKVESLAHERQLTSSHAALLMDQRTQVLAEVAVREESLRVSRRDLAAMQEQRGQLEIELAQRAMSVQNLRDKIREKYQIHLEDVRGECITITFADGGPPKVQTLTPEEMAANGAATDWAQVAEQVAALAKRLDEMGPVNLVAIEEYEETEQRRQFLATQYEDLVKAKSQLMEVINRINSQTREMFTATFNQIRDNFRVLFAEVFGGGKADLQLVDEGDVLESGIDIMARPPGKQLQSISLLSGGEQTMTAVALLFSIYQVKPSPFCVLDELDAPLDESNINRFIRVLQRFLAHSQFVIITHNKRTIGMADVLYGVTMQEHGVSRIVSVKFHKTDEAALDRRADPLVPPAQVPSLESEEDAPHTREETLEIMMAK